MNHGSMNLSALYSSTRPAASVARSAGPAGAAGISAACPSLKPLLLLLLRHALGAVRVLRRLGDVAQEHALERAQDVRPPVAHCLELARAGLLAWLGSGLGSGLGLGLR